MKIKTSVGVLALLSVVMLSGCWDRTEINDIALVMGVGFDRTKDGKLMGTIQIATPTKVGVGPSAGGQGGGGGEGGGKKSYMVETATGENINDVFMHQQLKLSRRVYFAHRRVLVIGERFARNGIKNLLDYYGRDPSSRLRTIVVVAKGSEAREILNVPYPIERDSTEGIREMEHVIGSTVEATLRDLLIATSSLGEQPVTAAIEPVPSETGKSTLNLAGTALFKDYRLIGYLNEEETIGLLCLTGKLKNKSMMSTFPKQKGNVNVINLSLDRSMKTKMEQGRLHIMIELTGKGTINENNTNLDLSNSKYIQLVQDAVKKTVAGHIQQAIEKAQNEYKTDIFGFGVEVHRFNPSLWKTVQKNWDDVFSKAKISYSVDVNLPGYGMSGPPLHLLDEEVKKK